MAVLVARLQTIAVQRQARALILLHSSPASALPELAQKLRIEYLSAQSTIDRSDRISALLGTERTSILVDCEPTPDLGLIAAAAGTLVAEILTSCSDCDQTAITQR